VAPRVPGLGEEPEMAAIERVGRVMVPVADQDAAIEFYLMVVQR
jgi:hypothetical protein